MSLMDCLLLTIVNAVICITLPKVISLGQQKQPKSKQEVAQSDSPKGMITAARI